MKVKINLLIIFSSIVLIGLSVMQYYLVKTAYDYKVAQFRTEIKEKIGALSNDYSDIDSTIFYKKDLFYKHLAENYILDKSTRMHIKKSLLQNNFKSELTRKLQLEFENELPDLKLDFAIVLDKFVVFDNSQQADTIFAENPLIENQLVGNLASLDDAFMVRNYVGTTSGTLANKETNSEYKLLTEDTLYVSVRDWELIVLKRMTLIFSLALLSILTLITLFTIAIKALIKQKKVSDVKTDFINNITHEFKTPLTTLSVATKILQRSQIKDDAVVFNNVIDTIDRQNKRLQHLTDQVMTSALGYAEIELKKDTVFAHAFINQTISDFKIAYPTVVTETDFNAVETTLKLDKFHLTTALFNVLENAVKYGCQNVTIVTATRNNQFNIAIQDDGIGIAKNKQPLLFDKFYRVAQCDLHNAKGLGLGLYYVDQIVKAHHGTIAVISDLGKGATFNIAIPFA